MVLGILILRSYRNLNPTPNNNLNETTWEQLISLHEFIVKVSRTEYHNCVDEDFEFGYFVIKKLVLKRQLLCVYTRFSTVKYI